MPVTIPMAHPADLADAYLKGVQTRAQIQEAQQRLVQQQQEVTARLQAQAQQQVQENLMNRQRINVEKAYHDQQIDLRKQQLAEVEKMNEEKTQAAARQYSARQQWQQGFEKIDNDPTMTDEQKDKAKTAFTMQLAPAMGVAGTEVSSMLRDLRPPKPTVPAGVEDKGEYWQVTNPTGDIAIHPKPKEAKATDTNVKVELPDKSAPNGSVLTTMPRSQAIQTIATLPQEWKTNAVNRAAVNASPTAGAASKFKKGDKARQNGVVYQFDGQTWNPIGD